MDSPRQRTTFESGGETCVAWWYPGEGDACIVMAGGFAVPKEQATDRFAPAFQRAGYHVVAFDYRRIGESGGTPRQVVRLRDQLDDWDAAIDHAASLPGVRSSRIALWGFSLSGGHVVAVAARRPDVAAAIAQTPMVDGRAATINALRCQTPGASLRLTLNAVGDSLAGVAGRAPSLVPLAGPRGKVAALTTPDAMDGDEALGVGWESSVAARSTLAVGTYRPVRFARRVACPLLVVVCDDDRSAPPAGAVAAAERAPRGELVRVPGGHYGPFLGSHEQVLEAELAFLGRCFADARSDATA